MQRPSTTHPPLFGQLVCRSIFFDDDVVFVTRRHRPRTLLKEKKYYVHGGGIIQQSTWWQIKQYTIYITLNIQQSTMANQTI